MEKCGHFLKSIFLLMNWRHDMELEDVPGDTEIVLKDEFDELRYRVQELEEELRKLKEYVEEATRLK